MWGGTMKVTWLGQAGFLLEKNGKKILIDPYLSDACGKRNPASRRRLPLQEEFLSIVPDVILLTHAHHLRGRGHQPRPYGPHPQAHRHH